MLALVALCKTERGPDSSSSTGAAAVAMFAEVFLSSVNC